MNRRIAVQRKQMKEVKIASVLPLLVPKYIKPKEIVYTRGGTVHNWETVATHDSVHVIVANVTNKTLLFVKQVRIPVLLNNPDTDGTVIECCAGIVDKNLPKKEIVQEEIREELGYTTTADKIEHVKDLKSAVGISGSSTSCFYAEVTNTFNVGQLLQDEEDIDILEVPYDEVEHFIMNSTTDASTLFLVFWWLKNKKDK